MSGWPHDCQFNKSSGGDEMSFRELPGFFRLHKPDSTHFRATHEFAMPVWSIHGTTGTRAKVDYSPAFRVIFVGGVAHKNIVKPNLTETTDKTHTI